MAEYCIDFLGRKNGSFFLTNLIDGSHSEATFVDNQQEGISRTYDRNGMVLFETRYENGKLVSQNFGLAALQQYIDRANSELGNSGDSVKVRVLDQKSLHYEYTKRAPISWLVALEGRSFQRRWHELMRPQYCEMLTAMAPEFIVDKIYSRVVDGEGKTLANDVFHNSECANKRDP